MDAVKEKIKHLSSEYFLEIVNVRRHLHANPELSKEEYQTAAFVMQKLKKFGIPYTGGIAGTGVVAMIQGKNPDSKVVGLRADMDALPILEENDVEYKSLNPGVMHACGHDVHTASLLGVAKILNELRNEFSGTVKLIFQPSEETYPGGAIMMINEGVLENPEVDVMIGQHVYPLLDAGVVGMKPGKYMASTDELFFTVKGRGGHGATPDLNIDPVVISAHIILALQNIPSRFASPVMPTVVSIGKVIANGKTNVIPNEVKMEGIVRTFDDDWRKKIHELIAEISASIARSMGGECELFIDKGYPALVNDDELTHRIAGFAKDFLGEDQVASLNQRMTAEDFAYFAQKVPGCFYRLGIRNEKEGITSNLHSSTFDVDETSLETGMGLMTWLAFKELEVRS